MHHQTQLDAYRNETEEGILQYLPPEDARPARLHSAMRYSLQAGGKRLRPILILAARDLFDRGIDALPAAVAMECLHSTTQEKVLAGILITRNSLPHPRLMDMLAKTDLPVLITHLHSFSTASRINKMTTKIQPGQDDKIARVEELVHQHVDLRPVLEPPSQ